MAKQDAFVKFPANYVDHTLQVFVTLIPMYFLDGFGIKNSSVCL